ncbi:MAG: ribulose-phosphate 3-epimerase [Elusimicrobiota bacterium]
MKISISVLNIDFINLKDEINKIEKAGADSFHMDIMDGHFVDNISFGPDVVKTFSRATSFPIHTHLMIEKPQKFVERFFDAGSSTVTVHVETLNSENKDILKKENMGISFDAGEEPEEVFPYLEYVDRVLVMSVYAGFGGQKFIEQSLDKIKKIADIRKEKGYDFIISVDGGVNSDNAQKCIKAGADELVIGSYLTKSDDPESRIKKIRENQLS